MNIEQYQLKSGLELLSYEFISEGPKGLIPKRIQFTLVNRQGVYNLAFGDKDQLTGDINDLAVTNNGDTEKVLATIVAALYVFFDNYPTAYVYATGSTKARTRLYRMGITKFYEEMQKDFYLYGQVEDDYKDFEMGQEYDGFLAQQKF